MKTRVILTLCLALLEFDSSILAAQFVAEDFSSDPATNGRFEQITLGTQSSFTYDATNQNLVAVLDVDTDSAYYLSMPFAPITDFDDASFSFNFRITELDNRVPPTAFIGLVTTTNVGLFGDGLTVTLSSLTNGLPAFNATVVQTNASFGGDTVPLALATDYLAIGRYISSNRQFTVEVYGGPNFFSLVGRSITFATNTLNFKVDRIGLQNGGGTTFDQSTGSITVVVDNIFVPARPPVNLSITTNVVVLEGNNGTTNAIFTVSLTSPSVQTVSVDYVTIPLTAISNVDFFPQTGTLVFPPGTNSLAIAIPVIGNVVAEPNRTLKVILTNAINANLLASTGLGTIQDDDICQISINDAAATEILGGSTDVVFTVSLSISNSQTVSVRFATADLTATAGGDYIGTNRLILFPPGVNTQTCSVTVLGDALDEANEVFLVNLSNPTNATLVRTQAQCIITNTSPLPMVFVDAATSVVESNATVSATFHLTPASGKIVTLTYATSNDTAMAGFDYQTSTGTVTFNPGQTNVSASIPILNDVLHESTEAFIVQVISVTDATLGNSREVVTIFDDDPIPSIDILNTGVKEGDAGTTNAFFLVRLSNPTIDLVTVHFATADGTATTNGNDYYGTNGTLTWPPGTSNTQSIPVGVIGDLLNELDETFSMALDTPSNATLGASQALCTITNDDFVSISISDENVVEGNGGSVNMVFTVSLSGPSAQQVSVRYFTIDGTTTAGSDYLSNSGILVFTTNTTQTITIAVLGDIIDEPDETFSVVLTNLVNATFLKQIGIGTIRDDDPPAISVNNVTAFEGSNGLTAFNFTVSLTSASTNVVTVNYSTSDGTATAGSDYLATNGVATFNPGQTGAGVTVWVIGDTTREPDETFALNLNGPVNATLAVGQGIGTIKNDDIPTVNIGDVEIAEGSCTNTVITLSETSSLPVRVTFCLGTSPTNGIQICTSSNCILTVTTNTATGCGSSTCCTIVIPPGELTANVGICVEDGVIGEGDALDDGGGNGTGGNGLMGGIGVADGDGLLGPHPTNSIRIRPIHAPGLVAAGAGVLEGNTGNSNLLCFTLTLRRTNDTNVLVDYFTADGSARAGFDYLAVTGTVVFPPGVITQKICVPIIGERLYETDETLSLVLTNVANAAWNNHPILGVITNDDLPPRLTINDPFILEGDAGTNLIIFTVSVLDPTGLEINVPFSTIDVTASNGFDYLATNGSLTFPVGVTNLTIGVPVVGDTFDEPNETFLVHLETPSNATLAKTNGVGTIIDDDPPEIRVSNPSVIEGNSGTTNLLFLVTLSSTNADSVIVDFLTLPGTATAGIDYVTTNGTLTFLPGETNKTVPVQVIGDTTNEFDETLFLCLTNALHGTLPQPKGTGTILNDDAPCLSITNAVVQEQVNGLTNALFFVTLDSPSSLQVSVSYSTSNGTATAGSDYVGQSGTLIFSNGVTTQSISIVVNNDLDVETNETFFVQLANPVNTRLCLSRGTGIILDGTVPPVLTVGDATVVEGNSGTTNALFPVTLSRSSLSQTITVDFATASSSALAGLDFVTSTGRVSFNPGTTSNFFAVPVIGDCMFEADEVFLVNLTNAQFAVLATNQVRGTIQNDDPVPTIFIDNASVTEGDLGTTNAVFKLRLSCPSGFSASAHYLTADGTATASSDYVATNGTVLFSPGATNATITVAVLGDFTNELDETFSVLLDTPNGAELGTNQAIGTILNDDGIILHIDPAQANEGGTALFRLTLSKPPSSEITVNFATADDTAIASKGDYVPTNVVIHFPAGITNQTQGVVLLTDQEDETNETFFVFLSNPVHVGLETNRAIGTIIDGNPPCLSVEEASRADDGSPTQFIHFPVTLSSTSSLPICVSYYTTNGTAIAGSDYTSITNGILCFPPGTTTNDIVVQMKPDTLFETNEYFCVILYTPSNATLCKAKGTGTIINPRVTNLPPFVTLTYPASDDCLTLPTNLTLVANSFDLDGIVTRVQFFDNGTRIGEVVTSLFSNVFQLTWFNLAAGHHLLTAVARDNAGALATSAPVAFSASFPASLSIDDRSVVEGNTGTNAVFTISLVSPSCRTVSVDVVTRDGTATAGSDYQAIQTNLTFYPDQIQKTFSVPIFGDTTIESNETFFVCLTNPVNASLSVACGTGIIINDDTNEMPTVSIISPAEGAIFYAPPGLIPITANALDPDGYVQKVDFYSGTNHSYIGTSTNAPFTLPWATSVVGSGLLTAIAIDNSGTTATSAPVHILILPCSGSLTATPLPASQNACVCEPLVFSTSVTSSDPVSFVWKANGRVIPGQTQSSLVLQSLKPSDAGIYTVEITTPCKRLAFTNILAIGGDALPNPLVMSNTTSITIRDFTSATPYPSIIDVKCVPGNLRSVTVTLSNLTHSFARDIDILLKSPTGKGLKIMSDAGTTVSNAVLAFSDGATASLPASGVIVSGTYKPTDYPSDADSFNVSFTAVTNLLAFTGESPNGPWSLYVVDDATLDDGAIAGGWSMSMTWDDSAPRLLFPSNLADGRFQMILSSQAGRIHVIEASTDLQNWIPVSTNTMIGANMPIVYSNPMNYPHRFFRVVRCPYIDLFAADMPPRLTDPQYLGGGWFRMILHSVAGRNHVIEASSDLRHWIPVSTNLMSGTELPIVAPDPTSSSNHFYRARVIQ